MYHLTYDSAVSTTRLTLTAPYYNAINPTKVCFTQEQICVSMDSLGHIEFFDVGERSLGSADFPVSEDPSKYAHTAQYGNMECSADGCSVTVYLPIYYWLDSYPHCDGESDRWTRRIERWFRVVFDCKSRTITVLDQDD